MHVAVTAAGGKNPDFGATFPQAVTITNEPAIPLNDTETPPNHPQPAGPIPPGDAPAQRMQAITNTAGFHFAYIEQGGSSLYSVMALKATTLEVPRIVVNIGGVETNHFSLWHDKASNAVAASSSRHACRSARSFDRPPTASAAQSRRSRASSRTSCSRGSRNSSCPRS